VIKEPYEVSVAVVYEKRGMCEANRMYGYRLIFYVCYRNSSKKLRLSSKGFFLRQWPFIVFRSRL